MFWSLFALWISWAMFTLSLGVRKIKTLCKEITSGVLSIVSK